MQPKIRILPENLCNKIAAGEVVERPASVVKELLENSLDAGATEIRVEVEGGGKRLIRVSDDGAGMGRDDVLLCLERHATSKISSDEDLFRLQTLGFRGEALPSIAAVSRLTLRSRPAEALEGWEIVAEGGTIRQAGAVGMAGGTTVEVRELFFNTPARRKFLRRDETELGYIGDVVTRLALARPQVRFSLVCRGRPLIEAYRHGTLAERVAALLGRPLLAELLPLDGTGQQGLRLAGFIGRPEASRATTGAIYTFINGRYIRDRVVQHAVMEGYRQVLPKGRYPAAVLFLEIDPSLVDVNVHPTKHEVRFREQGTVHDFIADTVRQVLRPSGWLEVSESCPGAAAVGEELAPTPGPPPPAAPDLSAPNPAEGRLQGVREALAAYAGSRPGWCAPPVSGKAPALAEPFVLPAGEGEGGGFFSALTVIGQYRGSYLVCQDGDDLLLIDQHAAHERIGFERLRAEYHRGRVESQTLLFPEVLEFDFREAAVLAERSAELERLGFELEPFGGKTYALKAVPRLLGEARAERLVRDVAAELVAVGRSGLVEAAVEEILLLIACHGAVRANHTLARPEIAALLRELDRVDFGAQCPHGRPVMQRLTLAEVERMFRRG